MSEQDTYRTTGIVADPRQTFGLEIEFDGGDPDAIARDLYARGLTSSLEVCEYHSSKRLPGKWIVEQDSTVNGEIVSPVLTDSEKTWNDIATVCEVVRTHGGRASVRTGGHVHVGVASTSFADEKQGLATVIALFRYGEDVLYRLGSASGEKGRHRGVISGYRWCHPVSDKGATTIQSALIEGDYSGVPRMPSSGISLAHLVGSANQRTVEFRYHDGTLDPRRLQLNVMIDCAIMRAGRRFALGDIPPAKHSLGTAMHDPAAGEDLVRHFFDMVCERPSDRTALEALYRGTTWQPSEDEAQSVSQSLVTEAVALELSWVMAAAAQREGAPLDANEVEWIRTLISPFENCDFRPPSEAVNRAVDEWFGATVPPEMLGHERWQAVRQQRQRRWYDRREVDHMAEALIHDMVERDPSALPATIAERAWMRNVLSPPHELVGRDPAIPPAPTRRSENFVVTAMIVDTSRGHRDVTSTTFVERWNRYAVATVWSRVQPEWDRYWQNLTHRSATLAEKEWVDAEIRAIGARNRSPQPPSAQVARAMGEWLGTEFASGLMLLTPRVDSLLSYRRTALESAAASLAFPVAQPPVQRPGGLSL